MAVALGLSCGLTSRVVEGLQEHREGCVCVCARVHAGGLWPSRARPLPHHAVSFCTQMLATLLITRQLLQNVREVLQPHLYRRLGSGELGLRTILELARALLGLLNPLRPDPRRHLEAQADEGGARSRRCLGGGCGAPEEEENEEEEAAVERRPPGEGGEVPEGPRGGKEEDEEEDDDEEEEEEEEYEGEEGSLLDCGLRLKKVSFAERGAGRRRPGPSPDGLLEEGSPTMVEKGLEPGVFTLAEEDDEPEGPPGSPGPEPQTVLLRRAGGEGRDQGPDGDRDPETGSGDAAGRQKRHNRSSWIDPPEEEHSPQLTQAELESCMKKYEVRGAEAPWRLKVEAGNQPGQQETPKRIK